MRIPRALTVPPLIALVAFGLAPLLLLAATSLLSDPPVSAVGAVVGASGAPAARLAWSLVLAAAAASLATALGVVPGLALGRSDLPRKPLWAILFILPLLLPPVLMAAGWRPWAEAWTSVAGTSSVARLSGACAVLALLTFPIPLFLTALAVRRTDRSLEDLSRLCGGRARQLRSLVLGLARPGLSLGWLVVFLLALSDVWAARIFGLPTYGGRIGELAAVEGWRAAGAASLPLLLAAALAAAAEARLFGERGVAFLGRALELRSLELPLGRWRRAVLALLVTLACAAVGAPLAGWVVGALPGGAESGSAAVSRAWSAGVPAFARSLVLALGGGSLAALIGLALAYAAERGRLRWRQAVDLSLVVLFAIPGAVLALGLLRMIPLEEFRASGLAIVAGLGVHVAVVPYRMERVALRQLGARAEEAGTLAGASWSSRVRHLILPLNAEFAAGAWGAALLLAFRDGGLGTVLSPGLPTLAALGAESAARSSQAAAALGLVAACAAAFTLLLGAALARLLARARKAAFEARALPSPAEAPRTP